MRYAREDLAGSEAVIASDGPARHGCWFAQQAAEKSLEAILVYCRIDFPHTHDLDLLASKIPEAWDVRQVLPDGAVLTEWAVESRYPGDWPDASPDDARRAAASARVVVQGIERELLRQGVRV